MKLDLSRREFHAVASQILLTSSVASALLGTSGPASAQSRTVKLSTFGGIDPQNYMRAKNLSHKTFGSGVSSDFVGVRAGSEVISAMAGGSLDIANLGSSPMLMGYINGLKASMIYVYKTIIDSERLVVQASSGIASVKDLRGKKVGVPFNTSFHFALLAALKTGGLGVRDVQMINMRADQIYSAWQRHEIDATYITISVFSQLLEQNGKVIFQTGDLNKEGLVIFDALLVRDDFKEKHPDLVLAFLKDYERIATEFKNDPTDVIATMTKYLSLDEAAVRRSLDSFYPIPAKDQLTSAWMGKPGETDTGVLKTLDIQAQFLLEAGQITAKPKDFSALVDHSFILRMVA